MPFFVHCSALAKIRKQNVKCPSVDDWIKKIHIHTYTQAIEYSAVRRKEILLFATAWMELKGMMLSEISQ